MQSLRDFGDRRSGGCTRMQGLSSRAHAFSVEALVGKSCKRIKVENLMAEKLHLISTNDRDSDTSTGTLVSEEEDHEYQNEKTHETCATSGKPTENIPGPDTDIRVELQGSDLWNRFHEIGTEMIITKAGRRMFPSIRVKVRNLDPFKQYYIAMDITPVDSKRYRYVYHSSQWMVAGNTDHSCISPRLYVHPDSPCSGETWMRQIISFDRVKLTNNEMDDKGHIILQSMHKYMPRVHVILHGPPVDLSQIASPPAEGVHTFSFPETQFTTVTAYQNQQITKLKIDRNPFAKGFRDPGRNRGVLDGILESYPWRSPYGLDLKPFTLDLQGGRSGCSANFNTISPLKSLLPHTNSTSSSPLTLSTHDSALHNLTIPMCYRVATSNHPYAARSYCSLGPDRLRSYPGLRPLSDCPLLCPLHGKKAGSCRGQCLQGPAAMGPCLLSLQNLQSSRASGVHQGQQSTVGSSFTPSYGLYSYSFPVSPHFSTVRSTTKPINSMTLSPSESFLCQTAWHSSMNHCL
ncbi:T-box transcription factor TBX22 [Electrophorus electricus]|uniref:T-box transcription factor TBX22 n=1 Tax=Electrophorus electricus TaxID=8005 RepID=UPI0015D04712|nr:T-box transcription factor TBX22 [Electrophorus electricus]